eukprot:359344-Chlamydomonas_euryale.AAC.5
MKQLLQTGTMDSVLPEHPRHTGTHSAACHLAHRPAGATQLTQCGQSRRLHFRTADHLSCKVACRLTVGFSALTATI